MLANREVGFGVNCGGEVQRLEEMGLKGPEPRVASSELGMQGRPADFNIALQRMQAIAEPDIDIDHRTGGRWPSGRPPKAVRGGHGGPGRIFLIEKYAILPQARLVAERVGHRDCAIDEAAAAHQFDNLAIGRTSGCMR
jgi:hypothetical protein